MARIKERLESRFVGSGAESAVAGYSPTAGETVPRRRDGMNPEGLEKTGRRDGAANASHRATLKRLFDASAGLSLAGCVPAEPASVSSRAWHLATAGRRCHPDLPSTPLCGMTLLKFYTISLIA